jgi:hypothetical protein
MSKRDLVNPELRQIVLARDIREWGARQPLFASRRGAMRSIQGCMAVPLAPSTSGPCFGKLTLDHVKDEPRMGKRAASDPAHLVSLCQGHTEDGMRGGSQWNTANRPLLRWYLRSIGANR